jgi:adenylate cyclase
LAEATIAFREVDHLRVVGREAPLVVFEPLAVPPSHIHDRYAEALAHLHAGRFADAVAGFATTAESDPAAHAQKERAAALDAAPPADWQGVLDLTRK